MKSLSKYIHCILVLLNINTALYTMDSKFIPVITSDKKEIKMCRTHLQESTMFRNYFEDFPDAQEIKLTQYNLATIEVLKRSLDILFSTRKKNPVYLKQFLKNLPIKKLYTLIQMTNYFDIQSIYLIARQIWINHCINAKNLAVFREDDKKDLMLPHTFINDISRDMSKIMLQKVLYDLLTEHVEKTPIKKNILFKKQEQFYSVTLNKDETLLAAACQDGTVYILNLANQYGFKLAHTPRSETMCTTFHPINNNYLATGYHDGTIRLWNVKTKTCTIFRGHTNQVLFLKFNANGTLLVSSSRDTTLRVWDMNKKSCMYILNGHTDDVWKTTFIHNDQHLLSASTDELIICWNLENGTQVEEKTLTPSFGELVINENNTFLVTDTPESKIQIFNPKTGTPHIQLPGHNSYIYSFCFYTNDILCSASEDRTIRFWNIPSRKCLRVLTHNNGLRFIRFSRDKSKLYSASEDGSICCWEIMSAQHKQIFDALKKYTTLPFARLMYLAWHLKKQHKTLDLTQHPHLQKIFDTFTPHYVSPELHKDIQTFLCKHLSIINGPQKNPVFAILRQAQDERVTDR